MTLFLNQNMNRQECLSRAKGKGRIRLNPAFSEKNPVAAGPGCDKRCGLEAVAVFYRGDERSHHLRAVKVAAEVI